MKRLTSLASLALLIASVPLTAQTPTVGGLWPFPKSEYQMKR